MAIASNPALPLLAYHAICARLWRLIADGATASRQEIRDALEAEREIAATAGEPVASDARHRQAREWHGRTGRCPWCGEVGPYHDPAEMDEGVL